MRLIRRLKYGRKIGEARVLLERASDLLEDVRICSELHAASESVDWHESPAGRRSSDARNRLRDLAAALRACELPDVKELT